MRILNIIEGTSVDGPGLRTSIYFAGCKHRCKDCHNPQSWSMSGGKEMTIEEVFQIVKKNGFDVTFSGGDPLYQELAVHLLAQRIKRELGLNIWLYTGFRWERIAHKSLLIWIDVVVDGMFYEALKDTSLLFRGSSNQRLIDVKRSREEKRVVEWKTDALLGARLK